MSIQSQPFSPMYDAGQTVTTGASANVTFTAGGNCLKLTNLSLTAAEFVYVKVGTSSQTATNNDLVVGAGETVYLSISAEDDNIATLAASGAPSFNIVPGHIGS